MGESTLLEGRAVSSTGGFVRVESAEGELSAVGESSPGAAVAVSIRPERLRLDPRPGDQAVATGVVGETVFQGGFVRVKARTAHGTNLLAKVPPEAAPAIGATVSLHAAPDDCVLLAGAATVTLGPGS